MSKINHDKEKSQNAARTLNVVEQALDPICGMTVSKQAAAGSLMHDGVTYFFCSTHCLEKFRNDPNHLVTRRAAASKPQEQHTNNPSQYTCPMHPEIVRDRPGNCPICGMALEPRAVYLAEEENPELVDMTRRFWISLALTVPVFLIGMSDFLAERPL